MDISKSVTYAFEDKEWLTKLGLGALVTFVPVLNFAWQGYMVQMIRNTEAGQPLPLPAWDDFDKKLVDGLKLGLAQLLYALPAILLLIVPVAFIIVPAFVSNENAQRVLASVGGLAALGFGCVWVLYLLAFSFIAPAIHLHFAHTGTFAACFDFRKIVQLIRDHANNYLTACAVTLVVGLVATFAIGAVSGFVGFIPCIGQIFGLLMLPVTFLVLTWVGTVSAFLLGQVTTPKSG